MAVFAKDFVFNDISLSSKSSAYALVEFDSVSDSSTIFERSVERDSFSIGKTILNDFGAIDSNVFQFDLTICKSCDIAGESFTKDEINELVSWLTSPIESKYLTFTADSKDEILSGLYFLGRFHMAEYVGTSGNKKNGLKFHFENISPYAFTKEYEYDFTSTVLNGESSELSTENGEVLITEDSQEIHLDNEINFINVGTKTGKKIYPKIVVTPTADGAVVINNFSDSSKEAFSINVTKNKEITIKDCNIYDSTGSLYSFSHCNNFNFPQVVDGENHFEIYGLCTIKIYVRYFENIGI